MNRLRAMRDTLAYDLIMLALGIVAVVALLVLITVTMPGVK
jgi:hypothetical protein